MYSFNWYYTESLCNTLTKDLPWFSGTKYANLYSFVFVHNKITQSGDRNEAKIYLAFNIVCRHLCLSLMLKLFSVIDLAK